MKGAIGLAGELILTSNRAQFAITIENSMITHPPCGTASHLGSPTHHDAIVLFKRRIKDIIYSHFFHSHDVCPS